MGRVTQNALRPLALISWMNIGPVSLFYMRSMCAGVQPDQNWVHTFCTRGNAPLKAMFWFTCTSLSLNHNRGKTYSLCACHARDEVPEICDESSCPYFYFCFLSEMDKEEVRGMAFISTPCFLALYAHAHRRVRPCHQAHRGKSLTCGLNQRDYGF